MDVECEICKDIRARDAAERAAGLPPKKVYRFSSSTSCGGYVFGQKVKNGRIQDKEGLRRALSTPVRELGLSDVTIRIYDTTFFVFLTMKPSIAPVKVIDALVNACAGFAAWHPNQLWTGIDDLQEPYVKRWLQHFDLDYHKGGP